MKTLEQHRAARGDLPGAAVAGNVTLVLLGVLFALAAALAFVILLLVVG